MLGMEDFAALSTDPEKVYEFMVCGCSCPISAFSPMLEMPEGRVTALVCIQCKTVYKLDAGRLPEHGEKPTYAELAEHAEAGTGAP